MQRKRSNPFHQPRISEELELDLAVRALNAIRNRGGAICDDCANLGMTHRECWASYKTWRIAVIALNKIAGYQRGEYLETQ